MSYLNLNSGEAGVGQYVVHFQCPIFKKDGRRINGPSNRSFLRLEAWRVLEEGGSLLWNDAQVAHAKGTMEALLGTELDSAEELFQAVAQFRMRQPESDLLRPKRSVTLVLDKTLYSDPEWVSSIEWINSALTDGHKLGGYKTLLVKAVVALQRKNSEFRGGLYYEAAVTKLVGYELLQKGEFWPDLIVHPSEVRREVAKTIAVGAGAAKQGPDDLKRELLNRVGL